MVWCLGDVGGLGRVSIGYQVFEAHIGWRLMVAVHCCRVCGVGEASGQMCRLAASFPVFRARRSGIFGLQAGLGLDRVTGRQGVYCMAACGSGAVGGGFAVAMGERA